MRRLIVPAAALALAACGETAVTNNQVGVPGPEPTQNQIESLTEGQRNGVFIRAIRDSGQDCQHVESSSRAGTHQDMPVWRAQCEGGASYSIVVGNDGTAYVLNEAEARLVSDNGQAPQDSAPAQNGQQGR